MWLAHTDFYDDCICALPPPSPFAFKEASQRQSCTKVHHSSAAGMSCEAQVLHHRNASWWFPKLVCAAVDLLPVGLIALLPSIKIETTIPVVQDSVGRGSPYSLGLEFKAALWLQN
uniref:Uncharacterized protein n=1 Tax=Micrurus surinamensis TaxID=129470 RepID=A0A2D4PIS5_MICSU